MAKQSNGIKKEQSIYSTKNYNMFRTLLGNRSVQEARVRKIMRSIDRVGYIPEPIVINERNEIIDGQGRLEAARRLDLPVYYTIIPGLGYEHCVEANNARTSWKTIDFINGFAEQGNTSYQFLARLFDQFSPALSELAIMCAASPRNLAGTEAKVIRSGGYRCTAKEYEEGVRIGEYLVKARPFVMKLEGRKDRAFAAVKFLFLHEDVDNEKLLDKLEKYGHECEPIVSIRQAVAELEKVYNKRNTAKAYVLSDYDKAASMGGRHE